MKLQNKQVYSVFYATHRTAPHISNGEIISVILTFQNAVCQVTEFTDIKTNIFQSHIFF